MRKLGIHPVYSALDEESRMNAMKQERDQRQELLRGLISAVHHNHDLDKLDSVTEIDTETDEIKRMARRRIRSFEGMPEHDWDNED